VANLLIEERLLHYFLAMGAQQTENVHSAQTGISFLLGSDKVHVVVLRPEDFVQRSKVIATVLSLAALRNSFQLVYLAAPRVLGASIDAGIFRSHGIGLLLFDERRIDETVPPQPTQINPTQQPPQILEREVVTELATLKSMYSEIEKTVSKLREDLINFQQSPERPSRTFDHTRSSRTIPLQPIFVSPSVSGDQLPSFFTNNPWLEVLSRRGRSGNEPIAG
jgi:hypothetical protein